MVVDVDVDYDLFIVKKNEITDTESAPDTPRTPDEDPPETPELSVLAKSDKEQQYFLIYSIEDIQRKALETEVAKKKKQKNI